MTYVGEELEQRKQAQLKMYGLDTLKSVASRLSSGITGQNKTVLALDMLLEALVNGCPYCVGRIYLDNGVIDHKEPIGSAVRNQSATSQARKHADRPANLHIICTPCNQLKGDFSHEEYLALRQFLNGRETLEMKLRRRLQMTGTFYKQMKARQKANGYVRPRTSRRFRGF